MNTNQEATTVAVVNQQKIQIIKQDGNEFVPIRPICEALGIDFSSQAKRLKRDQILSSTVVTMTTVGGDEKNREMIVLPLRYVFGWLFTIDSNQVKEQSREAVLNYQMQCYDALYDHFTLYAEFVEYRQKEIDAAMEKYHAAKNEFSTAKTRMNDAWELFSEKRKMEFEAYLDEKRQLDLFESN